jgi:hypothetical protein
MNLQRWNHYLSQGYQEGFTDQTGRVWVKFGDKPPEHRNPRSVGVQRSLYIRSVKGAEEDRIERFFADSIETPFASLVQRLKHERDEFGSLTSEEQGVLLRFVAAQAVRTLGHKHCLDIQAGQPVDRNTFLSVMLRQMWTIGDVWRKNLPRVRFFTMLPYVGEFFVSGDHPVLVIQVRDNSVWVPTDEPKQCITQLNDILTSPDWGFLLPLTPYTCVWVEPRGGVGPYSTLERLEPPQVRHLNALLRAQSKLFLLARDRESLN